MQPVHSAAGGRPDIMTMFPYLRETTMKEEQ
jgi:hypothetical protein